MIPEDFIEKWKAKHFAPVVHDEEWSTFKWHVCKKGEPTNPIAVASGGEIQVEQFGIIGWLYKIKNADPESNIKYFYQCPLIESREQGTGKFAEWLKNVQMFVKMKYKTELALATVTNQKLYKYCERQRVFIAVDRKLYLVQFKK